jgi:hypothetical protein
VVEFAPYLAPQDPAAAMAAGAEAVAAGGVAAGEAEYEEGAVMCEREVTVVCEPKSGVPLRVPVRAVGALAVVAVAVWAGTAVAAFAAAPFLAEMAVAVVMVWALCRCLRYGGLRKPRRAPAAVPVRTVPARALPAPPKAIGAPRHAAPVIAGTIVTADSPAWTPRRS